jgi:DNA polymerase III subunit delta
MRPATLILAGDAFIAQETLERLRAEAAEAGYAPEEIEPGDAQALLYAIDTPSLFGSGRFVVVRDAQDLPAEAQASLASWLKDPSPGIVLALVASGAGATKLTKLFAADAIVKADAVLPWKAAEWVVGRAKSRRRKITGEAAAALVEAVGSEPRDLAPAIERLLETTTGAIEASDVHEQFQGVESRIYQFVDAVFDRDLPGAMKRLRGLVSAGENAIGMVAALARQLRTIATVSGGDRRPAGVIAKELGLRSEGAVRRAQRQARNFSPAELRLAYRSLADADVALKSEEEDPLVLELAVGAIAGRPERAGVR